MVAHFPQFILSLNVPKGVPARLGPEDRDFLARLLPGFLPIGARAAGIMNAVRGSNPDLNRGYPLGAIRVPTLVIHAVDDPMPAFATAERMARQIPGARFVRIEEGGHLLLGHHARVREEIAGFIARHRVAPQGDETEGAVVLSA